MAVTAHRTTVSRWTALRLVSWWCLCGDAQVLEYGLSVDEDWAVRLAFDRAARHRHVASKETPDRSEPS